MTYDSKERNRIMRTKLMVGVMMLALPSGALAADTTTANDKASGSGISQSAGAAAAITPSAPQGPFFSRRMPPNQVTASQDGFPPMGFDPMNPDNSNSTVAQNDMPPQPGPAMRAPRPGQRYGNAFGNAMNNNMGGGTGGGTDVQVEVRGRIGLGGRGSGQGSGRGGNGFGNNGFGNFMQGMPYGMPYGQGYGAPYGTPYNHANDAPQYAPLPSQQSAPSAGDAAAAAPAVPQAAAQPQEPQWVKDSRAEADKIRREAEKRFAEMQKNNPYAQPYRSYGPGAYGQGYGQQPYGQGYGAPYGAPYGTPYGVPYGQQPYGYAPQPQQQAAPQGGEDGGSTR